jgi:hydrogenase maturation factor
MPGTKLSLSYGYIPCRLGLCGPEDKKRKKIIRNFFKNSSSGKQIKKIIREFKGAYPYYKLIARTHEISDPLDFKAVEAYWTGNSLLNEVKTDAYAKMMRKEFLPLGKMPKEKIEKLPAKAIPYHTFHVLFIGSVTGRFKETKDGLDLCRVSWGKIIKTEENKIIVSRQPLKFGNKITLGKKEEKRINWNEDILPEANEGDWVSIHWGTAIEKLNKKKLENIKKYTKHTLDILNGRKK